MRYKLLVNFGDFLLKNDLKMLYIFTVFFVFVFRGYSILDEQRVEIKRFKAGVGPSNVLFEKYTV